MLIDFDELTVLFFAVVGISLVIVLKKIYKKTPTQLFFISLFYIYICLVIKFTQFPIIIFTDGILGMPKQELSEIINIIPFAEFTRATTNYALNIVMTVPFGFLLPLIKKANFKTMAIWSLALPITIEGVQLLIALLTKYSMRIIDINDVIINCLGIFLGFVLYKLFILTLVKIFASSLFKMTY